jgi:MFS family permease
MDSSHIVEVKYDWSNSSSFHNYVERLDLACTDHQTIGLLGSMFFLGWCFTALSVPRISDIYGRKWTMCISLIVQMPCILLLIISRSIYLSMGALFVMGCCASGRVSVGMIYLMEMVPAKSASNAATTLCLADSTVMIFATLYFVYVSNDSYYWEMYALFANFLSVFMIIAVAPESPKFLFEKRQFDQCKEALTLIASLNGIRPDL